MSVWPCNADPFYPSWPGIKTIINDSVQQFFTINSDTINFITSGISNWRFCNLSGGNYFNANFTGIQIENILGMPDSVYSFTLQAFDTSGNPITHIFNNKELKISKSYGFVKTYDLNSFPNDTIVYNIIDAHRYLRKEIYGYNLGDEIHWRVQPQTYPATEFNELVTSIDTVSAIQIDYTIRRIRYYCNYFNPPVVTFATDTNFIIESLMYPDSVLVYGLPEQTYFPDSFNINNYTMYRNQFACNKITVSYNLNPYVAYNYSDSCFESIFESECFCFQWYPVIGNRDFYYCAPMATCYGYDIEYFNHNGDQCGTPNYISVKELENKIDFQLYPNPASDIITLDIGRKTAGIVQYEISDICGKKIITGNKTNDRITINISELKDGLYFLSVTSNNQRITKSFVISR